MELLSQNSEISLDEETKGFDLSAGSTWVYPENYPIRDYQFAIVQTALYNNTLVCLPTGLGKTFIAAVVMYNFWRWYPQGKIVFLAPTKPLVAQQIDACHNVMGIPCIETIELTGSIKKKNREIAWFKKRVIFATPQVFHNDLESNVAPSDLIKCVVVDEGHKALGKHSYCECIRLLSERNPYFRVLALSATPGNKIDDVHEVVRNLHIASLEIRDENSCDIVPYTNERQVNVIVVDLGEDLFKFKDRYVTIMDRHVKVLLRYNLLNGDTANISKGKIFYLLQECQKKGNRSPNHGQISKTLTILLTMYHAYELLIRNGLRAFCSFYRNHSDKFWLNDEVELQNLLEDIHDYLGPFPEIQSLHRSRVPDIPDGIKFGHKKFSKLKEILVNHFSSEQTNENSRAIVFVEYRDIVMEVYVLLLQVRPLIRPQMFVGQAGQKQSQQIKALQDFRSNHVNVLISTSIGEEGLDVGEVDLIVCFDISQRSPIRLVQRMGRTGRKRDGQIVVLVTDGKEHQALKSTLSRRDSINNKILNTSNIFSSLYEKNPRMVPAQFKPECHKIHIKVEPKLPNGKSKGKKESKKVSKAVEKNRTKLTKNVEPDWSTTDAKAKAQFSIDKFFKSKNHESTSTASETFSSVTQSQKNDGPKTSIDPSEVKLLFCDNAAVDFLTLCALKKSIREESMVEGYFDPEINTSLRVPKKNYFDFSVCDSEVLNCLPSLNDVILTPPATCDNENDATDDDRDNIDNVDMSIFDSTFSFHEEIKNDSIVNKTSNKREVIMESRLEDLLDEDSDPDSDCTIQSIELLTMNYDDFCPNLPETTKGDFISNKIAKQNESYKSLERSMFEDILDESSDSVASERDQEPIKDARVKCDKSEHSIVQKKIDNNNTNNCIGSKDDNISVQRSISESRVTNGSNVEEIERNKTCLNSSKDDMLSITQALSEINRINSVLTFEESCFEPDSDMFATDDEEDYLVTSDHDQLPIKNKLEKSDVKTASSGLSKMTSIEEPKSVNTKTHDIDMDFDLDDCDWTDVVACAEKYEKGTNPQISSSAPVAKQSNTPLKNSEVSCTSKSADCGETSTPKMTLAKKLASVKKPEVTFSFEKLCSDTDSSDNEWIETIEKISVLETSWNSPFFESPKTSIGTSSKKNSSIVSKSEEPLDSDFESEFRTKDFSSFKAPSKYTGRNEGRTNSAGNISKPRAISSSDRKDSKNKGISGKSTWKKKVSRQGKNEFICDEADVSSDAENSSDESSAGDDDLEDFVSYTQNDHNTSDMHALYLQSIRSPIKKPNEFLFKRPRPPDPSVEIYSQPLTQTEDTYLYDSFCVKTTEEEDAVNEYSLLELAEQKLKKRSRKRSRKSESSGSSIKKKKKIIKLNESFSSEDEIEQLRREIQAAPLSQMHSS